MILINENNKIYYKSNKKIENIFVKEYLEKIKELINKIRIGEKIEWDNQIIIE